MLRVDRLRNPLLALADMPGRWVMPWRPLLIASQKLKSGQIRERKKASKALSNAGSKTIKSVSKAAKLGMSFAQGAWAISDEGRNAREMSSYLNTASSMSPEYRRRFMYE